MSSKYRYYKLGPNGGFTAILKDGHYRVYDANGKEIWKSPGKSQFDKEQAQSKVNSLTAQGEDGGSQVKKDIVKENLAESQQTLQDSLKN